LREEGQRYIVRRISIQSLFKLRENSEVILVTNNNLISLVILFISILVTKAAIYPALPALQSYHRQECYKALYILFTYDVTVFETFKDSSSIFFPLVLETSATYFRLISWKNPIFSDNSIRFCFSYNITMQKFIYHSYWVSLVRHFLSLSSVYHLFWN
jgi:hypothetical protein